VESERLPAAKLGPKEHELHIEPYNMEEFAGQNKIQYCQKVVWWM